MIDPVTDLFGVGPDGVRVGFNAPGPVRFTVGFVAKGGLPPRRHPRRTLRVAALRAGSRVAQGERVEPGLQSLDG